MRAVVLGAPLLCASLLWIGACVGDDPSTAGSPDDSGTAGDAGGDTGTGDGGGEGGPPLCTGASCGDVKQLAAGAAHTCALKNDGTVHCWGSNDYLQLGTDAVLQNCGGAPCSAVPRKVAGLDRVTAIASAHFHVCALRDDKTVWCWGANAHYQLGHTGGTNACASATLAPCDAEPKQVMGLANVDEVATGWGHSCARIGSTVKCWGEAHNFGALGNGQPSGRSATPVEVVGLPDSGITGIDVSGAWACARSTSAVYCWGEDTEAQQGRNFVGDMPDGGPRVLDNVTYGPFSPTARAMSAGQPTAGIADMTIGSTVACLLVAPKSLRCWGSAYFRQTGDGNDTDRREAPSKVTLEFGDGSPAARISMGIHHVCALSTTGMLLCWGNNSYGQVGDGEALFEDGGTATGCRATTGAKCASTPTAIAGKWKAVAVGADHTAALDPSGAVFVWGSNTRAQTGKLPGAPTCEFFKQFGACQAKPLKVMFPPPQ